MDDGTLSTQILKISRSISVDTQTTTSKKQGMTPPCLAENTPEEIMTIKRGFDIFFSSLLLVLFLPLILLIALAVRLTSPGPVVYWSTRIGKGNRPFRMPKFRTMRTDTPQIASHLLVAPGQWMTPIGNFLRRTSLDELPQLWSILRGDMSFVGPRPALFNQYDLIALRSEYGVDQLPTGLTGWAQVNGRDESLLVDKVAYDTFYLRHRSLIFDLEILFITAWKVLRREGTAVPVAMQGMDQQTRIVGQGHMMTKQGNSETAGSSEVTLDLADSPIRPSSSKAA